MKSSFDEIIDKTIKFWAYVWCSVNSLNSIGIILLKTD